MKNNEGVKGKWSGKEVKRKGLESSKLLLINEGECIENISKTVFMKYLKLSISLTLAVQNHKLLLRKLLQHHWAFLICKNHLDNPR